MPRPPNPNDAAAINRAQFADITQQISTLQHQIMEHVSQHEQQPALPQISQFQSYPDLSSPLQLSQVGILNGHYSKIYATRFSRCSETDLLSASQDGKLVIWDARRKLRLQAISLRSSWVMTATLSPNDTTVASGGLENTISVHRVNKHQTTTPGNTLEQLHTEALTEFIGHQGYISSLQYLDENHIISASGDKTCGLWDIERNTLLQQFTGAFGDVMSVDTCGTNMFISGSIDGIAYLWDTRLPNNNIGNIHTTNNNNTLLPPLSYPHSSHYVKLFRGHDGDVNAVSYFPDGNAFVTASEDCTSRFFDIRACAQLNTYCQQSIVSACTSVKTSSSGRFVFAGYDDGVCRVWNTVTGQLMQVLSHDLRVSCVDVNLSGHAVATGGWDSVIKIFA